jgi:DNA invertase Pin-like site-specific DNA recombinase
MKRVGLYLRVSTVDQHPATQVLDLRQLAAQRGFEIVEEYTDMISGVKARRPGLDQLMDDARRGKFDVVMVQAFDRLARSVTHLLQVLDELNRLNIEFVSFRENIDTGGPLGRAFITIIGAIAELERNLIIERVRAGMRRARLEIVLAGLHSTSIAMPSSVIAAADRAFANSPSCMASAALR